MRLIAGLFILAAVGYADKPSNNTGPALSGAGKLAQRQAEKINGGGFGIQSGGCVNEPDCGEAALVASQLQAETTIAIDSTGQHVVAGFNDFRGFGNTVSISGFTYSDDGGSTFVDGGQLPVGPTTVVNGQLVPQIFGDPDIKYLGGCNFVYASILLKAFSATAAVVTLSVHRSTDCGHTWSGPFEVTPATNPNGIVSSGFPQDDADKELADVDPDTNRYAICWSNFTPAATGGVEISCTYSDNVMTGAPPVFAPRSVVAAQLADGQGSAVRYAGNSSPNAYIAWARFPSFYTNNIGFSRSTDNGVTWSAPVNLTAAFLTMDYVLGNDRSNTFPSIAVDKSTGPYSGRVYVVYANNNLVDGADVALQRSTDGGVTFSPPVLLNAKPGADRAQWFPYVTVDSTTGRVWVYFYDQGVATSGDLTQVTYLYSDDGGTNWSKPAAVTDRPFKAGWGNDTSQPNLGDYNQAVSRNGTLYAAYAATRQVGFTDGQPSGSMTIPDVFVTKVTGAAPPSLRAGAVTFTESGGNGNIDPGDQVRLKIPLENYVTNPLNAASVTGISATLSTATPGVSVVQAASAYANIGAGATTVNASDFILQVSGGFVPGTPIEMALAVTSVQGSLTIPLTQQTGTPVYTTLLSESFDGVAPGVLPNGWTAAHGADPNTVPWRTSNTFATSLCGASNKAFHANANDATGSDQARWERLFSPIVTVPGEAQYVTVEFDVCYDTEDDPVLPGLGYDGFFLRISDQTPGRTVRSVLAEAFEQEFTTGPIQHYPKHLPRNSDPSYFEDMSAWSGFSNGPQHVRMRLPGMAGSRIQLRFEFAQDQVGTCADVRPGHACGVTVDNVLVRSVVSVAPLAASVQVQPSLSRDAGTNEVVATLTLSNTGSGTASNVQLSSAALNSTPTSTPFTNLGSIAPGGSLVTTVRFPGVGFAPGSAAVLRVAGSYTGGTFSSSSRVTIP
jgi:hypothetical protein